jgi:hypothetical protein
MHVWSCCCCQLPGIVGTSLLAVVDGETFITVVADEEPEELDAFERGDFDLSFDFEWFDDDIVVVVLKTIKTNLQVKFLLLSWTRFVLA